LAQKPFIIGITGGSGSGKTTFKRQLAAHFSKAELCVVSQDDYYKPDGEQFIDANGVTHYDLPSSIDDAHFAADIRRLMAGESISKLEYTFGNPNIVPKTLTFHSAPIILVEGLFIFHHQTIAELLDFKVFIHAKDVHKIARRVRRDAIERGYGLEDVLYRYQNHVMPAYDAYIAPYQDNADIIINNNANFDKALAMMTAYLRSLL
jgi:uridine kinase